MCRPECEEHHTPARDNQYRATARYYKDSCPYCEIERLKGELEEARSAQFPTIDETAKPTGKGTMVVDCGTYSLELGREATALIKDLERQLDASQALLAEAKEREDVDSTRIHLFDEEVEGLRKSLAEARASIQQWIKTAAENQIERNEFADAVEQARQEAAREILADLKKCFFAVDFEVVRDNIKHKFKLEV